MEARLKPMGSPGRLAFRKFRGPIQLLSKALCLVPAPGLSLLWSAADLLPGKPGILLRYCIAKRRARVCGDNVLIESNVEIRGWDQLELGDNVSIRRGCYVEAGGGVKIGDNVSIAHQSSIVTENHTWDDPTTPIKYNPIRLGRVEIQEDVWIGCGCRVLAGVSVASRSVVAAGAVVTRDVPGHSVVAGIPARVVKEISPR